MGFRPADNVFRLTFEDPSYNGLIVMTRSVPVGVYLDLCMLPQDIRVPLSPDDVAKVNLLFSGFSGALAEWNLEHQEKNDDGELVWADTSADEDGMRKHDLHLILNIIIAWLDAVGTVVGPKAGNLTRGLPLEAIPALSLPT